MTAIIYTDLLIEDDYLPEIVSLRYDGVLHVKVKY